MERKDYSIGSEAPGASLSAANRGFAVRARLAGGHLLNQFWYDSYTITAAHDRLPKKSEPGRPE